VKLDKKQLTDLASLTCKITWGAVDILRDYYRGKTNEGNLEVQEKKGGPVTAADLAANHHILEQLQAQLGQEDYGYLSEETFKASGMLPLPNDWVWIVDPLDGTRDFIDKTGEYAIHIALTYQQRPMMAVVAIPEAEKIYYAVKGQGTFVETRDGHTEKVEVSKRNRIEDLTLVASRTHRDARFNQLIEKLPFKGEKYVGSVGCKVVTILSQDADAYISLSGKSAPKDWDIAAPELILTEAGGNFTRFDQSPLIYNKDDINQWGGLLASNGQCHTAICEQAEASLRDIDSNS
jgi:3'(2'), 5'-bisphosphate nucleotidase